MSRRHGRLASEALRIAVAENIAYLIRDHVRVDSITYETLRANNDLAAVQARWETPALLFGDFNDEPFDSSLVDHVQASSELDRVSGPTNAMTRFEQETGDYRGGDTFVYNASWRFLEPQDTGTFYIASTPSGEVFANRYQVLDQVLATRGLLKDTGLRLDTKASRSTPPPPSPPQAADLGPSTAKPSLAHKRPSPRHRHPPVLGSRPSSKKSMDSAMTRPLAALSRAT